MSRDDRDIGRHDEAIRMLRENQNHLIKRVNLLMVMVFVSLTNIPITLVM